MVKSITHCLVASAVQCVVGMVFGYPPISTGTFIAGMLAILINFDHLDLPVKRTPYTHSIFFAVIWITFISAIAYIYIEWAEITLAAISGFSTHLIIDYFTDEGIYLTSTNFDITPLRMGDDKIWKVWIQLSSRKKFKSYDFKLNLYICVVSVATIFICVML